MHAGLQRGGQRLRLGPFPLADLPAEPDALEPRWAHGLGHPPGSPQSRLSDTQQGGDANQLSPGQLRPGHRGVKGRRVSASPPKMADEIIETLRQDIVTRRLPDGERLPSEKELSDRFGVSQPTVREAIRALETLGLVEVLHGSGSFVRSSGEFALASALQTLLQLQSVGVMEVLNIRQALGRHSIELAAANATDDDIVRMG